MNQGTAHLDREKIRTEEDERSNIGLSGLPLSKLPGLDERQSKALEQCGAIKLLADIRYMERWDPLVERAIKNLSVTKDFSYIVLGIPHDLESGCIVNAKHQIALALTKDGFKVNEFAAWPMSAFQGNVFNRPNLAGLMSFSHISGDDIRHHLNSWFTNGEPVEVFNHRLGQAGGGI